MVKAQHINYVGNGGIGNVVTVRLWSVTIKVITLFGITFPLVAVFIGLAQTFLMHYDVIYNHTDCHMPDNKFISMSIVGSHYPQKFLWNLAVFCYALARAYWGLSYFYFFKHCRAYKKGKYWCWFRAFCDLIILQTIGETTGLYVVISVTIDENFFVHAAGYVAFSISSICYMGSIVCLQYASGFKRVATFTFYAKFALTFLMSVTSLALVITYPVHLNHCFPWAYQVFTLFEYFSVFVNTSYHALIYKDLKNFRVNLIGTWTSFETNELLPEKV